MNLANHIIDHVERIEALETNYDTFKYLKQLSEEHGLGRFMLATLSSGAETTADISIVNNFDPEFIQNYDAEGLLEDSPVVDHYQSAYAPLFFHIETLPQKRSPDKRDLSIALAHEYGMQSGLCFPLKGINGEVGGLELRNNKIELAEEDKYVLHLTAQYAYDKYLAMSDLREDQRPKLSSRELECLDWIARGKTSAEIASILSVSEHTVIHYLASACKKLDATNRVQAVARSLRLGLLS